MTLPNKLTIDFLHRTQSKKNDGRGISCVKSIVTYLNNGDFESAKAVRVNEGDKTISYPDVEAILCDIFGCRAHGKQNCDSWLCK